MQAHSRFPAPRVHRTDTSGISLPRADLPEAKSAARLAAEAAFSVSTLPPAAAAPNIIVRRSKGLGLTLPVGPHQGPEVADAPGIVASPQTVEAGKAPRIFRLAQTPVEQKHPVSGPAPMESDVTGAAQTSRVARRKKSVASEHRPGPVVHIFKASAPATVETSAEPGPDLTHRQLAALSEMLASVQHVLDDVQRAQALRF